MNRTEQLTEEIKTLKLKSEDIKFEQRGLSNSLKYNEKRIKLANEELESIGNPAFNGIITINQPPHER